SRGAHRRPQLRRGGSVPTSVIVGNGLHSTPGQEPDGKMVSPGLWSDLIKAIQMTQRLPTARCALPRAARTRPTHAVDLLRADHRRIHGLFGQFARSTSPEGRAAL